jgi:hypothetical protein
MSRTAGDLIPEASPRLHGAGAGAGTKRGAHDALIPPSGGYSLRPADPGRGHAGSNFAPGAALETKSRRMVRTGETSRTRAAGLAAPLARAVGEDLEQIFPNAAPARSGVLRLALARRGDRRREAAERGESHAATAGAIVAAAFVGVLAGALLGRGPAPAPAASNLSPVMVAAPAGVPVHGAAPAWAAVPIPEAATSAADASPPRVVRVRKASAHRPVVRKIAVREPARARAAPAVACRGARCASPLMQADARLRQAYAAAIRAEAPRSVVVDYRNEWEQLRQRAPDQPGLVTARYNEMAGELRRMAVRRQAAAAPRPSALPRGGARTQLAALWR